MDTKIAPFTSALIVESLGEAEPELLSAVTEHVLAHKGPAELADELEAVSNLFGAPLFGFMALTRDAWTGFGRRGSGVRDKNLAGLGQ